MIPLIPSPGRPKTVSTPQSANRSISSSAAICASSYPPVRQGPEIYRGEPDTGYPGRPSANKAPVSSGAGRFTLGVGAGERLNEHVVGLGFPGEKVRHERFREALEIIRLLWQGGYQSYEGKHLQLEDARVFDLPDELPVVAVAGSGPVSARLAAELGDGLFATEPDGDLVRTWHELGGRGPAYAEMPVAWAPDEDTAVQAVLEKSSFSLTGWKVMSELPNPVNFEAATAFITADQVRAQFACGPDVRRHLEVAQPYVDAGFDRLVTMNGGPDPDGFLDFFARELSAPLRALTPKDGDRPSMAERVSQAIRS